MTSQTWKAKTVVPVAGLVEYQEGSIVSREIAKKPGANMTAFAFDKGQGLSEHTSPYDAFVQVVEGRAEIRISGEPFSLTGGEMILMPAGEPHALKAVERFKMLLVLIK